MKTLAKANKFGKSFVLSMLIFVLCCSIFVTPAYAWSNPGPSTFGPGTMQWAGELEFEDNNGWTGIKTLQGLGQADEFWLWGYFKKADTYNGLVKLTVKIQRVSDGKIIYSDVFTPNDDGTGNFNTGRISVNPYEEKIRIYFDASTYNATPPGPYRKAYVTYDVNFL